jgi:hypothetical protein
VRFEIIYAPRRNQVSRTTVISPCHRFLVPRDYNRSADPREWVFGAILCILDTQNFHLCDVFSLARIVATILRAVEQLVNRSRGIEQ